MLTALYSGLLTGWAIAIPVGAVAVLVVTTSAQRTLRHGSAAALGVAAVDGAYAALAVVGGGAIAAAIGPYRGQLRVGAAVILLGMAAKLAWDAWRTPSPSPSPSPTRTPSPSQTTTPTPTGPPRPGQEHDLSPANHHEEVAASTGSPARTFWTFAAITAVNPATVIYFAAVVLAHEHLASGAPQAAIFVIAAFAASASWQLLLALAGAGLGRTLTGPNARRVTGMVAGLLIAGLALSTLAG